MKARRPRYQLGVGTLEVSPLEKRLVLRTLQRNRLSWGPLSARFEQEFARLHHRRFAVMVNSGTSALELAIAALRISDGWRPGDEVIVPAITFIATSNVCLHQNLKPVFVDVDPLTYNIDPSLIEKCLTKRTRAIMPVHLFGLSADMEPILAVARKHKLRIIEDSCETAFVNYKGRPVGSLGDIACFSTYVAHLIVTGVGGLACTNDRDLAVLIKSLANHGRDGIYLHIDADRVSDPERLWQIVDRRFRFTEVGYSYRATEMEAALGVGQLQRWKHILTARQKNAAYLTLGLADFSDKLQLPTIPPDREHAFMMYPIVIRDPEVSREKLIRFLEENQIETRYMMPLLNQPIYKRIFGDIEKHYPVAHWINEHGFYIGCHQGLSRRDLDWIIQCFHRFFEK